MQLQRCQRCGSQLLSPRPPGTLAELVPENPWFCLTCEAAVIHSLPPAPQPLKWVVKRRSLGRQSVRDKREHQKTRCLLYERGLILTDERERHVHVSLDSTASPKALVLCFFILQLLP